MAYPTQWKAKGIAPAGVTQSDFSVRLEEPPQGCVIRRRADETRHDDDDEQATGHRPSGELSVGEKPPAVFGSDGASMRQNSVYSDVS